MIRLLLIFTLFSSTAFAESMTDITSMDVQNDCKATTRDLRQIRNAINTDNKQRALRLIDRLLSEDPNKSPDVFSYYSVRYKKYDSSYRCSNFELREVIRNAENAAMNACYSKGKNNCRLRTSYISHDGHIGTINGTYYGYGCAGLATVHGG